MIMKRKEAKDYGTRQLIEGEYLRGDRIVLIDDVITSGGSLIETIADLEKEGLIIEQVIVLIDRRPLKSGRPAKLVGRYPLRTVFTMENLLERMSDGGVRIPDGLISKYRYGKRVGLAGNPVGRRLLKIVDDKQTNLVLSADLTQRSELLTMIDLVGPEICAVKTHIDILEDFEYSKVIPPLLELAKKHNFLIIEDRKFADIGNTVKNQYRGGVHRIGEWADLVTVHGLLGEGIVAALGEVIKEMGREGGILLLAELSNAGNMIDENYTERCCVLAERYPDTVAGVISQRKLLTDGFLHATPGVNLVKKGDKHDQVYKTPDRVIGELESDLMIVGRGIYKKVDPVKAAQEYRLAGWAAYQKRVGLSK
jgi:uridine monophosphate synthetase